MHVAVIYSYARFEALKANWDALYDKDPDAQFFLSWLWLSRIFQQHPDEWCVLAVRPEGSTKESCVAFLPLRRRTGWDANQRRFGNRLAMAGTLFWSDYTGLLCDPGYDDAVLPALAGQLKQMHWHELALKNVRMSGHRLALLTKPFENSVFTVQSRERVSKTDGVDLLTCPYIDLPDDFDTYLTERLSANMRQKVRRFLRRVEDNDDFSISISTAETLQRDLEVLSSHWKARWAERKGDDVDRLTRIYRRILEQAAQSGCLFMPVLWHGDRPVGALASFVDRQKQELLFFVAGRDEDFDSLPAGLVLHAFSIRWAIEQGIRTYDFLRGDERYKLSFGAIAREIGFVTIGTRSGVNLNSTLDPRSIGIVLGQATRYLDTGRPERAAVGFRQILEVEPGHATALRRYGRLLYARRDFAESAAIYRRYTEVRAEDPSAWQGLGGALLAQNDFSAAERALRHAMTLGGQPTVSDFVGLGRALHGQDRMMEAQQAFLSALGLEPGNAAEQQLQLEAREYVPVATADSDTNTVSASE